MKEDTASGKETEQSVRSLPIDLWPIADRVAWQEACRPSVRLKRGGAASHMWNVTHTILAKRCGYFFDFLSQSGRLEMSAPAGAQVTPDNVEAYVGAIASAANTRSWSRSAAWRWAPARSFIDAERGGAATATTSREVVFHPSARRAAHPLQRAGSNSL
jgi:hypothetical protein